MDLKERTCLECYQVRACHPVLCVCEPCFRRVIWPAIKDNFSAQQGREEQLEKQP